MVLLGPACILPQEDTPLVQLNRPPRVVEENLTADKRIRRVSPATNCPAGSSQTELSAPVADFDVDDVLTYRFYVDYDVEDSATKFVDDHTLRNPDRTVTRKEQPRLVVDVSSTGTQFTSGTHLVELWVTDGQVQAQSRAPVFSPNPDGGITFHAYATSYAWQVEVTAACP